MLGIGLGITSRLRSSVFNPASLFRNGEQGWFYDLSDMSTLFQEAAGITPVTAVGQPVGLCLDKSKGLVLGPELVTNGDFSNGIDGWAGASAVVSADAGTLRGVGGGVGTGFYGSVFSVVSGNYYRFTFRVKGDAAYLDLQFGIRRSSSLGTFISTFVAPSVTTSYNNVSFVVQATATVSDAVFFCRFSGTEVVNIDNISVRELPGNHRSQSASLPRPTYARHPLGGIRNLLTFTEEFDNAGWAKNLANAVANSTNDPTGAATGDTLRLNAGTALATSALGLFTNSAPYVSQPTAVALAAGSYTYSAYVKGGAGLTHVQLRTSLSATLNPAIAATIVRLSDGAVVDGPGTVSDAGNGWWRVSLPFTATAAVHHCGVWFWNASSISSAAGAEGIFIWGAQLELGSTATAYQRVVSRFDVTEAGQPDLYYLAYDGADDCLSTAPFAWGSDKATVVAGVRKLSDAAAGIAVEFSVNQNTNSGGFFLAAPLSSISTERYGTASRGSSAFTASQQATTGQGVAPDSAVITAIHDIAGDLSRIRRNGVVGADGTADKGTGNFGTHAAFFGARAGTSVFFKGWEYSNVGISRLLTTGELAALESWTAGKAGNTL